jgi:hypothetical protein
LILTRAATTISQPLFFSAVPEPLIGRKVLEVLTGMGQNLRNRASHALAGPMLPEN